ncbi:MAG TPA: inverse autotransporter beta domain-containing protein, partial [Pseudolabrys sp.]|nr:inverse autotransporter beta domain-containing protein [Pseudolabrys sp.]
MFSAKVTRQTQSKKSIESGESRSSRHYRSEFSRHLWKTSALSTIALAGAGAAHAQDALWQPQVQTIVGGDHQGAYSSLEGFIPLTQTPDSVVFLDLRLKHDFSEGTGGDVGLGLRRVVNPDLILGGYAYLNVERLDGHQFTGATLGVEAIATNFDAHVNVHLPFGDQERETSTSTSSLSLVGNQLLEQISVLSRRDYASWGVEGEFGVQAPIDLPKDHALRLHIGGYHFEDAGNTADSVTGGKAGFEYKVGNVLGDSGASLTFGGEVRYDDRDDTTFAGFARLTIPLGGTQRVADGDREPLYNVSEGLRKRANERVRGDIGVRLDTDETAASLSRRAINARTGSEFGLFFFADGENTLGLGTLGDPTTLDDAVNKAGSGFVVALGGSGNLLTGGATLTNGQTVIGGGQTVQAILLSGSTSSFALGGSDGTIQGSNLANPVLSLGNGNTLQGITVTGGEVGIFGNNINGATLTGVTVDGTGSHGASFTGTSTGINAS